MLDIMLGCLYKANPIFACERGFLQTLFSLNPLLCIFTFPLVYSLKKCSSTVAQTA